MRKVLFIILLFFAQHVSAQNVGLNMGDSLIKRLATQKDDTIKVNTLKKLTKYLRDNDPDKSILYCQQGLSLTTKLNDDRGQCYFYGVEGEAFGNKGDWKNCTDYLTRLYNLAVEKKISSEIARASSDLGAVYENNSDFVKAQDYFFKCLSISEKINNYFLMAISTSNIGIIYQDQFNYVKEIEYQQKTLQLIKKYNLNRPTLEANALSSIGGGYIGEQKYDEARKYLLRALTISQTMHDTIGLIARYQQLVATYPADYHNQLFYSLKAGGLSDKMDTKNPYYIESLGQIGNAYKNLVKYNSWQTETDNIPIGIRRRAYLQKAENYLEKGLRLAKETNERNVVMGYSLDLAEVYDFLGRYKEALEKMKEHQLLSDSIYSQSNKNKIASLEGKHEIELRDKQLEINKLVIANQQKQKAALIGGLAALFLIAGLIFYQNSQRRKANKALTQLNGQLDEANKIKIQFFGILNHDLRSPVASFVNLLHLQKEAPDLLDEKSKETYSEEAAVAAENLLNTMDDLLLWSKGQMENFKPNLRDIKVSVVFDYLRGLSSSYKVSFNFRQPENMTVYSDEYYLRTIIHNLSINAVKALKNSANGTIEWKAWEEGSVKYLSIRDNGPGATEEQLKPLYDDSAPIGIKSGLGLHIIRDIAKAINCKIVVSNKNPGVEIRLELAS